MIQAVQREGFSDSLGDPQRSLVTEEAINDDAFYHGKTSCSCTIVPNSHTCILWVAFMPLQAISNAILEGSLHLQRRSITPVVI